MPKISVIIPVHKDETTHKNLVQFFDNLNDSDFEIIQSNGSSRAKAMNTGAKKSNNEYLWFLHADSTIQKQHIETLKDSLNKNTNKIHYFDLKFSGTGPLLMPVNSIGANIRSRLFNLPWGDQAFCLSKEIFEKLGRYDENAPYGEDHLLIWSAHHNKVKLKRLSIPIISSSRKYSEKGWLKLTVSRQYYWLKQAMPQLFKLIRIHLSS